MMNQFDQIHNSGESASAAPSASTAKSNKACIKCRRLKMKCIVDGGPACRRCTRAGVDCIFKPRANAASHREASPQASFSRASLSHPAPHSPAFQSVLDRIDAIEAFLSIEVPPSPEPAQHAEPWDIDQRNDDPALANLWSALSRLREKSRPVPNQRIWSQKCAKQLWLDFHKNMPGLHFLPTKQSFSAPTPLLLASMLYVSSLRHSDPDLAVLSRDYFTIMCGAISELCVPPTNDDESTQLPISAAEEKAFQDVLGIILAGLTCEATTKATGIWISIGYRLVLESCPKEINDRSREWQKIFSGLQILDLEHASLHMSYPIIPIHAPFARLHTSSEDDIGSLTHMMHTGLTHFTGRGLPTIWSWFSGHNTEVSVTAPFTTIDAAIIRDWASQLDRWLARFNSSPGRSEHNRALVFRQYILHRLLVLSIYHPARGFNLFSYSTTSTERNELLLSARAALKMQLEDKSIWGNWDFVMLTWAALLILQGIEGGVGEQEDLPMIQDLLNTLRKTQEPQGGLKNKLADKLETSFQSIHTPPADLPHLNSLDSNLNALNGNKDMSWSIFDEMSLQFPNPTQWSMPNNFGNS